MSLIININSLSYLYDYLDLGVHDFIVGTNQFSCRQALTVDYIELKEIKEKYPMIRLFVLVNALVEQKYLDDLKNHLPRRLAAPAGRGGCRRTAGMVRGAGPVHPHR